MNMALVVSFHPQMIKIRYNVNFLFRLFKLSSQYCIEYTLQFIAGVNAFIIVIKITYYMSSLISMIMFIGMRQKYYRFFMPTSKHLLLILILAYEINFSKLPESSLRLRELPHKFFTCVYSFIHICNMLYTSLFIIKVNFFRTLF